MTERSKPVSRRGILPLSFFRTSPDDTTDTSCIPNKCIWKCGAACYHEAPNEADAERQHNAFADVLSRRIARRTLIKGAAAATVPFVVAASPAGGALLGGSPLSPSKAAAQTAPAPAAPVVRGTSLGFSPITLTNEDVERVPDEYERQIVLRWGDPIVSGAERLTMENATPQLQQQTFGYNNDLLLFFPTRQRQGRDVRGVLWVNHEYTEGARMFSSYDAKSPTKDQVDIELAAHGGTVVELSLINGEWTPRRSSSLNRRLDALSTEYEISGPLRGHPALQTSDDPSGTKVIGMLNNCAGGKTPWGTVLTAEENWNQYFANNDANPNADALAANKRYGVGGAASTRSWELHYDRFDLAKEPNEINRFGYIVEIDPLDPDFTPRKRTAMGRFKHEAATPSVASDKRVAFYSGDDERFDYLYKFITRRPMTGNRRVDRTLLDDGDLYVARFNDDGTGEWILLSPETDGLEGKSMADILLYTRQAGDAVGATPMDRPEDVEVNPRNHRVYIACTNNTNRTAAQVNGANPRPSNGAGHIIELSEDGGDSAATSFTWEMFMLCGRPTDPSTYFAGYDKTQVSAIGAPDNVAFDGLGNLWIATDGQRSPIGLNDALFAVPTGGPDRGRLEPFYSAPLGAEVCGPEFTSDYRTVFLAIQHPGENSAGPDDPETLWPDDVWPPLPSVIAIRRRDGGRIGS